MFHFKIKELLLENGYPQPAKWLMTQCGLPKNKAYNLISGKQKSITLDDLARICKVVDCLPNDLLYWKQTKGNILSEGHSCLTSLTPPDENADWNKIFNKISQADIADIKKYALRKVKKK